jgi:hypothetical protein
MQLPQQQRISLMLVTGLAALVAALAAAAMAATPGYAMPADAGGQTPTQRSSVADVRSPDRQAPAPEPATDVRSPDRQAPAPEPAKVAFSGSASTTDMLGPEDGTPSAKPAAKAPVVQAAPTWPSTPTSLPAPVSVSSDSDGLEIGSAAVGAAGMMTLGLLGLMAYASVIRRRPVAGH